MANILNLIDKDILFASKSDKRSVKLTNFRILAELKTRAFMVLSLEVRDPAFADEFLSLNNDITETMSTIAHLCTSGMWNMVAFFNSSKTGTSSSLLSYY